MGRQKRERNDFEHVKERNYKVQDGDSLNRATSDVENMFRRKFFMRTVQGVAEWFSSVWWRKQFYFYAVLGACFPRCINYSASMAIQAAMILMTFHNDASAWKARKCMERQFYLRSTPFRVLVRNVIIFVGSMRDN